MYDWLYLQQNIHTNFPDDAKQYGPKKLVISKRKFVVNKKNLNLTIMILIGIRLCWWFQQVTAATLS